MKLDCLLTSVNENPLYLDFVPIFIKTWNKLYPYIDVIIILIAKNIPDNLLLFKKNIILFKPIENVLTSFTSQFIRLLYPCILNYKNGVLITDIDMLPMNNSYYTKNIIEYDNNKFIYYRGNVCFNYKQIAMCYNVATPETWKYIFKVNSLDDIVNYIKNVSYKNIIKEGHGNIGWCIDQITLYNTQISLYIPITLGKSDVQSYIKYIEMTKDYNWIGTFIWQHKFDCEYENEYKCYGCVKSGIEREKKEGKKYKIHKWERSMSKGLIEVKKAPGGFYCIHNGGWSKSNMIIKYNEIL